MADPIFLLQIVHAQTGEVARVAAGRVDSSNIQSVKLDGSTALTVQPLAGSTFNVRALNSTASDLKVSAFLFDSTGNAVETSTFAASTRTSTVRGLMVRQAVPDCTSAAGVLATAGDNTLLSSAATSIYVYAIAITGMGASTVTPTGASSAVILRVQNGTTSANLWRWTYQQSTINGFWDSMFVNPPAYLFRTGPGNLLNLNATSTGAGFSVAAQRE